MKVFVLLSLVALSVALPTLFDRSIRVEEDGTVTLLNSKGFKIDILKSLTDPRKIILRSPITRNDMFEIGEPLRTRDLPRIGSFVRQDYNQGDILVELLRQYEGRLDDRKYYSLLNRIELLVEAGIINESIYEIVRNWGLENRVEEISDIVPIKRVNTLRQYVGQAGDVMSLGQEYQYGTQRKWNLDQDWFQTYSPVKHFQTLLEQIQQQREIQQGLLGQQQYLPRDDYLQLEELNSNQILNEIYRHQIGQSPLNRYLVNMRLVNGQEVYDVPEEFMSVELIKQIFVKQELLNKQWTEVMEVRPPLVEYFVNQQELINEKIEKVIEQLVYHQNLITRQVEQYIGKGEVVPQQLVYQQRLVYQQVHELIEHLQYQQVFVNQEVEHIMELGVSLLQIWIVQQNVLNEQIQKLIQQVIFQQTHVKEEIQVLIQQRQVIPQELVLYQIITYESVERFLQVLIKQLIYQQNYFKQLIQILGQQRHAIPQEVVSQYEMIYRETLQLIQRGDMVPQDLIYQQRLIHQQIVLMLQQLKVVPQQLLTQLVSSRQQELLWPSQSIYQKVPSIY